MTEKHHCSVDGCTKPIHCRGLCRPHYMRRWRRGIEPAQRRRGYTIEWLKTEALNFSSDDCLVWPFNKDHAGYGTLRYDGRPQKASRVVCSLVHGAAPSPHHEAAHSCGNGRLGCVNPRHIRWATPRENQADRIIHGTSNRGKRGKLTAVDVRNIRSLAKTMKQQAIADRYGMHQSSISYIINNKKNWVWLDE